jgi:molybdate-binding protein/DNA-binding XRE family transcriptional regulator
MIVSNVRQRENRVKARRTEHGLTQAELAQRAAISRAAVSAIEIGRLVPSVTAALSIATVLDCSVEELFSAGDEPSEAPAWAWPPTQEPCRYWHANVGRRVLRYPVEALNCGVLGNDGVYANGTFFENGNSGPESTLVVAGCDPAVNLLAAEVARSSGFRLLCLSRSGRSALDLLGQGLVHVAGVHFATSDAPNANGALVEECLGNGFKLVRGARWQEGLSIGSGVKSRSVRSALSANLRWVGRESGSAARQCLDELAPGRTPPQRLARDHRGVAEAIRCGWADIGVCLRLVSEEAGLNFLPVREEHYDLCYAASTEPDPRIQALLRAVRSTSYRRILGELPGFDTANTGESLGSS